MPAPPYGLGLMCWLFGLEHCRLMLHIFSSLILTAASLGGRKGLEGSVLSFHHRLAIVTQSGARESRALW